MNTVAVTNAPFREENIDKIEKNNPEIDKISDNLM